jgi:hypothetical protein
MRLGKLSHMKRAILFVVAFILTVATLLAQTIAGTRQGTLPSGATGQGLTAGLGLRIVFTIEKNPNGSFYGGVAPINRGRPMPLTAVTFSAPNVAFASGDTLTYRDQLSADGQSIAGIWTQGPQFFPLALSLARPGALWKPANVPQPMAPNVDPAFEAATIKPSCPDQNTIDVNLTGRPVTVRGVSATELIKIASRSSMRPASPGSTTSRFAWRPAPSRGPTATARRTNAPARSSPGQRRPASNLSRRKNPSLSSSLTTSTHPHRTDRIAWTFAERKLSRLRIGRVRTDGLSQCKNPICAWTVLPLDNPEADSLPLLEALVGVGLDGAVVDEDIRASAVAGEKAIAFAVAESLHGTQELKQGSLTECLPG